MALTIVKPENIAEYIGKDLGTTEWFTVDQDRINKFADATEDHQFIHVDPEQATPIFGSTIAHGFLSLALTAGIGKDVALVIDGAKMGLNYGLDKVRFLSPVPVNSRIRMHSVVMDITEKNPGQFLVKSAVTMEIEGVEKPAFIAETLSMWVL
ncbi:MAG: MaoC family dehydratase [Gammaproteobacteria bacterium]|jgi:acyl dehydratase|tara:strand:+ start:3730 stop:4188 length:459 start_codon:yes stop_codon:yes gene_type:complete